MINSRQFSFITKRVRSTRSAIVNSPLETPPPHASRLAAAWPWLAIAATLIAAGAALRFEGRIWFCKCWTPRLWVGDAQSEHTSQHLLDPYSFTHLQHGLIFFLALQWLAPRLRSSVRMWLAIVVEAAWEIVENSAFVIQRYRDATAARGYEGDSVWNSLGDVLACAAGYPLAEWLGLRGTVALFFGIEAALLATIRDSLLLNVLMLFWPVEWIKNWQMGGAAGGA